MFSRLNQVARHFSRPLPNYLHNSAASASSGLSSTTSRAMAQERSKRLINTAACLIIGDEVLGGKVSAKAPPHLQLSAGCSVLNIAEEQPSLI